MAGTRYRDIDDTQRTGVARGQQGCIFSEGGTKEILKEETPTIDFAYACVVTIRDVAVGERFTVDNIWVKRPGTGKIKAEFLMLY